MSIVRTDSNTTAPTQFLEANGEKYAYRRFGSGSGHPLLFLQHFMGTLDNWDYAVTDSLALGREVILFDNTGIGRSSGKVPPTISGMAEHVFNFPPAASVTICHRKRRKLLPRQLSMSIVIDVSREC